MRQTIGRTYARGVMWAVLNLSPRHRVRMRHRARLAEKYLRGEGLEIGALHMPVRLPRGAKVRYVDYQDSAQQRETYPELAWVPVVPVHLVADGQTLAGVEPGSVDFVIANHVIEHCEDPLGAIEHWIRVLRPGGVLYLGVPDKRHTFDRDRPLTSVQHVLADHRQGAERSRAAHWDELTRLVYRVPEEEREAFIARNVSIGQHPHYHVWTRESFEEMLAACGRELRWPIRVEEVRSIGGEFIAILRKAGSPA